MAELRYFLDLDDNSDTPLSGDLTLNTFEGLFELSSFAFQMFRPSDALTDGGGSKVTFSEVQAEFAFSTGSVGLFNNLYLSKTFSQATIYGVDDSGRVVESLDFETPLLSRFDLSGDDPSALLASISLVPVSAGVGAAPITKSGALGTSIGAGFDVVQQQAITYDHSVSVSAETPGVAPGSVSYFIRIDGIDGPAGQAAGFEGWFALDDFDLDQMRSVSVGTVGGGAGKAVSELSFDIAGLTGFAPLLQELADGSALPAVQIVGTALTSKGALTPFVEVRLADVVLSDIEINEDQSVEMSVAGASAVGLQTRGISDEGKITSVVGDYGWSFLANDKVDFDTLAEATSTTQNAAGTADSFYIGFDGLSGAEQSKAALGFSKLESFDFELDGSGGKLRLADLSMTGDFSALTTQLHKLALTGVTTTDARIIGLRGTQKVYELEIEDFVVEDFETVHPEAGATGADRLSLDAKKIEVINSLIDAKTGVETGTSVFSYDFEQQKSGVSVDGGSVAARVADDLQASRYYLKIDGFNGAAADAKAGYDNWIELESFGFDSENSGFPLGGAGAGKSSLGAVNLTGDFGNALPWLLQQEVLGTVVAAAELHAVALDGSTQRAVDVIKLTDLIIDVDGMSAASDGDPADMSVALTAQKVGIQHNAYAAGSKGTTTTAQEIVWDQATAQADQVTFDALATVKSGDIAASGGMNLTYYLGLSDVTGGPVLDKNFKGFFEVHSLSLDDLTTGAPLTLTADLGLALNDLMSTASDGTMLSKAYLIGVDSSGDVPTSSPLFALEMEDVQVAGVSSGSDGTDTLSLGFGKFETLSWTRGTDGKIDGTPVSFGYDRTQATEASVNGVVLGSSAKSTGLADRYYVRFDGLTGTSDDDGREGWYDLDAWLGGGLINAIGIGGKTSFKSVFADLALVNDNDPMMYVALFEQMTGGTVFDHVVIEGVNVNNMSQVVTKVVLNDAQLTGLSNGLNGDVATLSFGKIGRWDSEVDVFGKLAGSTDFAWDVAANKAMTFDELSVSDPVVTNIAPVVTVDEVKMDRDGFWLRLSDVLTFSDAEGDAMAKIELRDTTGIDNWYADGGIVDASAGYETSAVAGVWMRRDSQASTQAMEVRAFDGQDWSDWASFNLITENLNTRPVLSVDNQYMIAGANNWRKLTDVMTTTDADGDAIVSWQLWDSNAEASWWADGGLRVANAGYTTSNLGNIYFRADTEASTQTLWVRGFDGYEWGNWDAFQLNTRAANSTPETQIGTQVMALDAASPWLKLTDVLDVTDADGDAITKVRLWDSSGENNWYADGRIVDASSGYVTDSLSNIWLHRGTTEGAQTLWVSVNDGFGWSDWDDFRFVTRASNTPAQVTVADQSIDVGAYQWVNLSKVAVFSDADGDAIDKIQLWDSNGASNWWADGRMLQNANGYETDNIASVWFTRDSFASQQTLWVRAHDGIAWGTWSPFTLTTTDLGSSETDLTF